MRMRFEFSKIAALFVLACPSGAQAAVEIRGIEGDLLTNALAHLQIDDESCDAPAWRVRRLYQEAEAEIRLAMQAYGYYSAEVDTEFVADEPCWSVVLTVDPGPVVRIRRVDVEVTGPGREAEIFQELAGREPWTIGDALRHADYDAYKQAFTATASRQGYFDGRFTTNRIDVYPDELAADITLAFDTGTRYRFGAVTFDQDVLRPQLAAGYIDFAVGAPYEDERISRLYEALLTTGFFNSVDIRTTPRGDPHFDVPVEIRMTAARHRSYTAGIGFGTDVGPKVRAGYLNRRLNSKGHQFEIRGSYSSVIAEAGISYRLPLNDPRNNWLNFDTGYKREDTVSSYSETYKIGAKRFRQQTDYWLRTLFIDYGVERFVIGTDIDKVTLLVPGISWEHTLKGGPPRPMKGAKAILSLSGAWDGLLSDTSFAQVHAFGKIIQPAWSGARMIGRAELGATAKDEFSSLPASVRFFAGGDVSVRGYEFKSLGPKDENGFVTGGAHLAVFSFEFDQAVAENWSVAAFVDAGNAFNSFDELNFEVGVGAGVRWYSVLGPIRVDFAVPLADDAPDDWRVHITLGPDL
jgi:translocation and assembly module TamA